MFSKIKLQMNFNKRSSFKVDMNLISMLVLSACMWATQSSLQSTVFYLLPLSACFLNRITLMMSGTKAFNLVDLMQKQKTVKHSKRHLLLVLLTKTWHPYSVGWVYRIAPGTVSLSLGILASGSRKATKVPARCSGLEYRTGSTGDCRLSVSQPLTTEEI